MPCQFAADDPRSGPRPSLERIASLSIRNASGEGLLVNVPVPELAAFLRAHPLGEPGLEHVFDY